jgi:hypothetical protein
VGQVARARNRLSPEEAVDGGLKVDERMEDPRLGRRLFSPAKKAGRCPIEIKSEQERASPSPR